MNKEDKAKEMLKQVMELFEGEREYSHMSGDILLCGKTADDALRVITDKDNK